MRQGEDNILNTREIIRTYRGWRDLEKITNGAYIIDFDLALTQGEQHFKSRIEVLDKLTLLYEEIPSDGSEEERFIKDRIKASIYFLRALMGEQIPFREYILHTMGIEPRYFSPSEIEEVKEEISQLLSEFDLEFSPRFKEKFEQIFLINEPETIRNQILANKDIWLRRLSDYIPIPENLNLKVEFVTVDDYWYNWTSGSAMDGITLRINLHPRKRYDKGKPLSLCFHEICGHAVQMAIWSDQIKQGRMNEAIGITTVHAPEAFLYEGLAQNVWDFIAKESDLPVEFLLSERLNLYTLIVLNNVHSMINNGSSVQETYEYASNHLPFTSNLAIESEIRDRSRNPLNRTYQYVYALSRDYFQRVIPHLSIENKKAFLKTLYYKALTPVQIQKYVKEIQKHGNEVSFRNTA